MGNLLQAVISFLTFLSKEIKILPATGGAIEELQHPDQEEKEELYLEARI